MSGELRIPYASGATVYANVLNSVSRRWNGASFEAYSSPNYPDYVISMLEQGTSGIYVGDFPTGIIDAGSYGIIYYFRVDASPAEGDPVVGAGTVNWDGSSVAAEEDVSADEMSGSEWESYVLRSFKRTDKQTELFESTNAAISEIRRRFTTARDEKETAITDTIDSLGQYKLDVETDFGMMVSDVFIRSSQDGYYLDPIGKSHFDDLYSKWGTDSSERGRPIHYCLFGGQILLGPVPDSIDYTYVKSYGRANLTPVNSASSAVPYTKEDYKEILRDGVLWRLYKLIENDDQAGAYKALWDNGLAQMESLERKNKSAGMFQMAYNDV